MPGQWVPRGAKGTHLFLKKLKVCCPESGERSEPGQMMIIGFGLSEQEFAVVPLEIFARSKKKHPVGRFHADYHKSHIPISNDYSIYFLLARHWPTPYWHHK
jgi:hypothetical protein